MQRPHLSATCLLPALAMAFACTSETAPPIETGSSRDQLSVGDSCYSKQTDEARSACIDATNTCYYDALKANVPKKEAASTCAHLAD
jgi:hypothetical protein